MTTFKPGDRIDLTPPPDSILQEGEYEITQIDGNPAQPFHAVYSCKRMDTGYQCFLNFDRIIYHGGIIRLCD